MTTYEPTCPTCAGHRVIRQAIIPNGHLHYFKCQDCKEIWWVSDGGRWKLIPRPEVQK